MKIRHKKLIAALAVGLGTTLLGFDPAFAQLSTATIKGQITDGGAPAKSATVVATNKANGFTYRGHTNADGSYTLTGLAPGAYEISVSGTTQKSDIIEVHVGETASIDLAVGAAAMDKIVVVGSAQRVDVKTSEVGTNVSRTQIENLPQVTRNFLSFADLAPGVRFNVDQGSGNVKMQSGAQNQDNVNIFIDGVSQKNQILRGGVSGMDASRGNPFPQIAVAEYKVISQNYKAEYDQVSSAAITAITKSGTNELHGDVFWDHTTADWVKKNPHEVDAESQGVKRPNSKQDQFGFSLGGPIQKDVMHFFVAYEGKEISTPRQVVGRNINLLPNTGVGPSLLAQLGATEQKFKENLFLGKIDAQIGQDQRVEVTARLRRESDFVPEDAALSVPGNDKDRKNDETRFDVKHELTRGDILNEARFGYEKYSWNPHSKSSSPEIRYQIGTVASNQDVLLTGGSPDAQDREQKGTHIQDDVTFTGLTGHTFKGGAKISMMKYDLGGTARSVDQQYQVIDPVTGIASTYRTDPAIPPVSVNIKNNMWGMYLQDDWSINRNLELNIGLRWDYEDNMLNNSYVTPADRVAVFNTLETYVPDPNHPGQYVTDGRGYTWQLPVGWAPVTPGQTYRQSLARGGVNIDDYISTGSSRKPFKSAFAPRLGFSHDLNADKETVVFGGWGRAYDRTMANHALDETQKNQQPNGEIWMINNTLKMPYTDQWSLGLRQRIADWNGEVGYTNSNSKNQFTWSGGNRDPQGGFGNHAPIDPLWNSIGSYGTLILGDFNTKAKTETVYVKADKPYSKVSGWGLFATYTYSDAKTTNKEWTNDIFNWIASKPGAGWFPSKDVERHRLVVAGLTDSLLPWGLMLSGKMTVGSGLPTQLVDCHRGFETATTPSTCVFQKGEFARFHQIDLGLSKDVPIWIGKVTLRLDVLNVLNSYNYGSFDNWVGGPSTPAQNRWGGDNGHVGQPNLWDPSIMAGPMRTYKLAVRYSF